MSLSMTHFIKPISELLCLLSLIILVPRLIHLEEIVYVCFYGEKQQQFA